MRFNLPGFLASLERRRPDVVIANFELGPDDGLTLLRRVKALRLGTPVFMLENRPAIEAAVAAMKAGAADVLTTPIDNEHLVGLVRDALRQDVHVTAVQAGRRAIEVRGLADSPSPSRSQAISRCRAVSASHNGCQSHDAVGKPWISTSGGASTAPPTRTKIS